MEAARAVVPRPAVRALRSDHEHAVRRATGAARSHARRVPRRLPADAPGRPFGAARSAAARRPARRHLRRRPRRRRSPSSRSSRRSRIGGSTMKWPDYLDWCDQLYFAVPVDFPAGADPRGDRADRGRRLWRRDPAPSAAPAGGGGAPQVAADRLRAARVANGWRGWKIPTSSISPSAAYASIAWARHGRRRRRSGRGWPRPCGCGHRP